MGLRINWNGVCMTQIKAKRLDRRYQVIVRYMGSDDETVVMSYERRQVADRCAAVLRDPKRPDRFVDDARVHDTWA